MSDQGPRTQIQDLPWKKLHELLYSLNKKSHKPMHLPNTLVRTSGGWPQQSKESFSVGFRCYLTAFLALDLIEALRCAKLNNAF
jgi:hypothetical protein